VTSGAPIPARLPPDAPLFDVPDKLCKILNRDLKSAGVPKRDERGRTVDVHALRHTFGTLLSKGGVAPRTAQAAMRHSDIQLTMRTYTDPRLLDVRGALDALPTLTLDVTGQSAQATGTADLHSSRFAPRFAPTHDNPVQKQSIPDTKLDKKGDTDTRQCAGEIGENIKQNTPLPAKDKGVSTIGVIGFEPTTSWSRTKRSNPS